MTPLPEQDTVAVRDGEASSERFGTRLNRAVGHVASRMASGALSTGDLAELRRISLDAPVTPTLWRLLYDLGEAEQSGPTAERRWATLFMGMAYCAGLHDYDMPLGRALAEAGWSEVRLTRLLEEQHERRLATRIRRMAQYLANKKQKANWADVARLLFFQSGEYADTVRLGIARAYYATLYRKENE